LQRPADSRVSDDLVEVHILGMPVALARQASEHFDELSREFLHLANSDDALREDVPGRLLALSDDLRARFSGFTAANEELIDAAMARDDATIDLVYRVPRDVGSAAARLGEMLDEADRYCSEGQYLLTLQTPRAVLEYRRWYIGQFVDQAAGLPPRRFAVRTPSR
jgi:hypothetical protein